MAKEFKDMVFALDIGTAKVMVVAAEVMPDGELRVAGLGVAPTHGLKRGVVVNIDATVASIQQALKEAEMMAACKIDRVYTGITGSHIRGQNSTGMVIVRDNREVTPWTWHAWSRPPRPSTSPTTSACCWWSRRNSSSTGTR
jgi:cell division protein FtsA